VRSDRSETPLADDDENDDVVEGDQIRASLLEEEEDKSSDARVHFTVRSSAVGTHQSYGVFLDAICVGW